MEITADLLRAKIDEYKTLETQHLANANACVGAAQALAAVLQELLRDEGGDANVQD